MGAAFRQNCVRDALAVALRTLLIVVCGWVLAGCAAGSLREVVPPELADKAQVVGVSAPGIRIWGDEPPKNLALIAEKVKRQRRAAGAGKHSRIEDMLVISGGGSDGAFGAGLLNGWSQRGDRPEFTVVTGVSTGALMAPFAFLGPSHDRVLKEFYTRYSTKDIIRPTVLAPRYSGWQQRREQFGAAGWAYQKVSHP